MAQLRFTVPGALDSQILSTQATLMLLKACAVLLDGSAVDSHGADSAALSSSLFALTCVSLWADVSDCVDVYVELSAVSLAKMPGFCWFMWVLWLI